MNTIHQLQRWVISELDRRLFPFVQNGRLNLSGLTIGKLPSGSSNIASITQSFINTSEVIVDHQKGYYPIVQVLTLSGQVMDNVFIIHDSINTFVVRFHDELSAGWGDAPWGLSGYGGGSIGSKWGIDPWGDCEWGGMAVAPVTASGTIVYL